MRSWMQMAMVVGAVASAACSSGTGAQGEGGKAGAEGANGANGANGADGKAGQDGATGPEGPAGPVGPAGAAAPFMAVVDATGAVVDGAVDGLWTDAAGYQWVIDFEEGRPYAHSHPFRYFTTTNCSGPVYVAPFLPRQVTQVDDDLLVRPDDLKSSIVEAESYYIDGVPCQTVSISARLIRLSDLEPGPDLPTDTWTPPLRREFR